MNRTDIEQEARRLQYEIWHKRNLIWPLGVPSPIAMFDPRVAAKVLDLEYEMRQHIASAMPGHGYEAAGVLDRRHGIISISTKFKYAVQRFTGAHEIGHFMLHPEIGAAAVHRDRPIFDVPLTGRSGIEQEADYFGACFLAPRKQVTDGFCARFGSQHPLRLTETIAFHLRGDLAHELFISPVGSLDFAAAVAGAQKFDVNRFPSLAEHFGMSVSAMAIRLKELRLVTD